MLQLAPIFKMFLLFPFLHVEIFTRLTFLKSRAHFTFRHAISDALPNCANYTADLY